MNNKKTFFAVLIFTFSVFLFTTCDNGKSENYITPKELPVLVPGFNYPENPGTILSWMSDTSFQNNYDSVSVYNHGWGLWAGLTANSDEVFQGDSLLIYETWLGVSEVSDAIVNGDSGGGSTGISHKKGRTLLGRPHQFEHGPAANLKRAVLSNSKSNDTTDINPGFWVTVSYDPNAARFAIDSSILKQSVQNKYFVENEIGNIPWFPPKAITIKPMYFVGSVTDSLVQVPVWSGSKDIAYPANLWPTVVYADIRNRQIPGKKLFPVAAQDNNRTNIANATCNLSDFINFTLDQKMADHMNQADSTEGFNNTQQGNGRAIAGQVAILVSMHVATKEISNWTWQTFYWAPDPTHPLAPSSDLAARLRPKQLSGAASHYALVTAYAMVLPNQPNTGGTKTGLPVFGFNPYLESQFDSSFNGGNLSFPNRQFKNFYFGHQTNCMSCHTLASPQNIPIINGDTGRIYSTVQYIPNNDSFFINKVRLDFAWSLYGDVIKDVPIKQSPK